MTIVSFSALIEISLMPPTSRISAALRTCVKMNENSIPTVLMSILWPSRVYDSTEMPSKPMTRPAMPPSTLSTIFCSGSLNIAGLPKLAPGQRKLNRLQESVWKHHGVAAGAAAGHTAPPEGSSQHEKSVSWSLLHTPPLWIVADEESVAHGPRSSIRQPLHSVIG